MNCADILTKHVSAAEARKLGNTYGWQFRRSDVDNVFGINWGRSLVRWVDSTGWMKRTRWADLVDESLFGNC